MVVHDFKVAGSGIHIIPLQINPLLQSEFALHEVLVPVTIGTHYPLSQTKLPLHAGTHDVVGVGVGVVDEDEDTQIPLIHC